MNDTVKESNYPDGAPRPFTFPSATNPPEFGRFYGLDRLAYNRVPSNPATDPLPRSRGGFLSNEHVA